jgi:hypothetical protein
MVGSMQIESGGWYFGKILNKLLGRHGARVEEEEEEMKESQAAVSCDACKKLIGQCVRLGCSSWLLVCQPFSGRTG